MSAHCPFLHANWREPWHAGCLTVAQVTQELTSHHRNFTGSLWQRKNKNKTKLVTVRDASGSWNGARLHQQKSYSTNRLCGLNKRHGIRNGLTAQSFFSFESFFRRLFWVRRSWWKIACRELWGEILGIFCHERLSQVTEDQEWSGGKQH